MGPVFFFFFWVSRGQRVYYYCYYVYAVLALYVCISLRGACLARALSRGPCGAQHSVGRSVEIGHHHDRSLVSGASH